MLDENSSAESCHTKIEQLSAHLSLETAGSGMPSVRSLGPTTAAIIGGLLLSASFGTIAAGDPTSFAQTLLNKSRSQIQDMVISMSQGCSGGAHGVPPVSWAQLQPHGNSAVNALATANLDLERGDTTDALQKINIAEGELEALVNGIHDNCSGGAHGQDPVSMNNYLAIKAVVEGRLDDVKIFLGS